MNVITDNALYVATGQSKPPHSVRSQGGLSELRNLACLCMQCHNQAHGVFAKEIRKHLLEEVEKRTDEYEKN